MQIQFDPFASVVAVAALVISVLAYRAAKRAPHEDRVRSNRDAVRTALREAFDPLYLPIFAVANGAPVERVPDSVKRMRSVLAEVGPRLPEHDDLAVLKTTLARGIGRWEEVVHLATMYDAALDEFDAVNGRLAELKNPERRVREARAHADGARSALDAARVGLRDALIVVRDKSLAYINKVDSEDRRLGQ